LTGADLRDGALAAEAFADDVTTTGSDSGAFLPLAGGRPLEVAERPDSGNSVTLSRRQLLINQRISQEAIRRSKALTQVLNGGLTGGNLVDGTVGAAKLAPGVSVGSRGSVPVDIAPTPISLPPAPERSESAAKGVRLSATQLLINQRIAQAAVRSSNALSARLERGLTGGDIVPGSISVADLAPVALRRVE
jgi:hypothetical protein